MSSSNLGSSSPHNNNNNKKQISQRDLDTEDAETHLVQTLEERGGGSGSGRYRPYVETDQDRMETRVIGILGTSKSSEDESDNERMPKKQSSFKAIPKFKSIAMKVRLMQKMTNNATMDKATVKERFQNSRRTRNLSKAQDLLASIQEGETTTTVFGSSSGVEQETTATAEPSAQDLFHVVGIETTVEEQEENLLDEEQEMINSDRQQRQNSETLPLIGTSQSNPNGKITTAPYGSVIASQVEEGRRIRKSAYAASTASARWIQGARSFCSYYIQPQRLASAFYHSILCSYLICVAVPLFALAILFYYELDNPIIPIFRPEFVRFSYWLNFIGRQILVEELARLIQWFLLDCFMLGTKLSARVFGPYLTIMALQARGWPFIITTWAILDFLLLHGRSQFAQHWLFWTGIKIYSIEHAHSGASILYSSVYTRILCSMVIAGMATTMKRAILSLRFGKRVLAEFKPRMEKLLADIVLLNEIAILAQEAQAVSDTLSISDEDGGGDGTTPSATTAGGGGGGGSGLLTPKLSDKEIVPPRGLKPEMNWGSVKFAATTGGATATDLESDSSIDGQPQSPPPTQHRHIPPIDSSSNKPGDHNTMKKSASTGFSRRDSSGHFQIRSMLDHWEEPVNMAEKGPEPTIQDVLKFRRALAYMDMTHPFGEAYGPASTRDECIQSAHDVYYKLMKFAPDSDAVHFEVLSLVALDDDDVEDTAKVRALKKLFRPDCQQEMPLLAFIQSCDTVYKRLRYFRASVSNFSAIDNVLEGTLNGIYWFVLILVLLATMNFNPWPLLASIMSLLVSVSFALGSSVSKYVEGVLLIAVRRPFDLGDRILVTGAETVAVPGVADSWFVEDINLFKTTLRFAKTNQVATINNFSISQSRIINLQRSVNAIVFIELTLHARILKDGKLDAFIAALNQYIKENPRRWESMAFCRHDEFNSDWDWLIFRIAVRHRLGWQNAARINLNRADLMRFIFEKTRELHVDYETPPLRRLLYNGGDYYGIRDDGTIDTTGPSRSPNTQDPAASMLASIGKMTS